MPIEINTQIGEVASRYAERLEAQNLNPLLARWSNGAPNDYTVWSAAPTQVDEGVNGFGAKWEIAKGQNGGLNLATSLAGVPTSGGWLTITQEVSVSSGTFGGAGVRIDVGSRRTEFSLSAVVSSPSLNKRYRVTQTLYVGTSTTGYEGYWFANYAGSSSPTIAAGDSAKTITLHSLSIREASGTEITAAKGSGAITVGGDNATYGTTTHENFGAALQAALDAHSEVHILPGTWTVNTGITCNGAKRIYGAGERTKLRWSVADHGGSYLLTLKGNSRLQDVYLQGVDGATNTNGLLIQGAYSVLDRVWVQDMTGRGIKVQGASGATAHYLTMNNVGVKKCDIGIHYGSYSYDGQAANVWVGYRRKGLYIEVGQQRFTNLHVFDSTEDGVFVRAPQVHITNAYIERNGKSGINAYSSTDLTVISAHLNKNGLSETAAGAYVGNYQRAVFVGCTITNNKGLGISLSATSYGGVMGCQFGDDQTTKTQTSGIKLSGATTGVSVIGNKMLSADHIAEGFVDASSGENLCSGNGGVPDKTTSIKLVAQGASSVLNGSIFLDSADNIVKIKGHSGTITAIGPA